MSEAKHTPGPWLVERQIANYRSGATSLCITSRCEGGVTQTVASIVSIDSGKANAKLIAAAPELLEALRELMAWHVKNVNVWDHPVYDHCANIVEKATGSAA